VVSGWEAVLIVLGPAIIAGAVACLLAWANITSQRRQDLRTRRIEAASDFSRRFIGASDALRYAIDHGGERTAASNAAYLVGEVTPLLGPLSLLFGDGSAVERRATGALADLRRASTETAGGNLPAAEEALASSRDGRASFEEAVRNEID
jgi:hypothetical protein